MYKKIKSEIDKAIGKSQSEVKGYVERALCLGIPYVMRDYYRGLKMVKYLYDQLKRVNSLAVQVIIGHAFKWVGKKSGRVCLEPSRQKNYSDFTKDKESKKKAELLLKNAISKIPKKYFLGEPITMIAEELNEFERKLLTDYCKNIISYMANKTNWNKDTIGTALSLLAIEYSICRKDEVMDIFFNSAMCVINCLNSSMYKQQARDLANTILLIGYREHLEEYSYVVSSSAYIDEPSPLQALLCLEIAFAYVDKRYDTIPKRIIFNIIWILLKILREIRRVDDKEMKYLLAISDSISNDALERMSVQFTALSAKVFVGDVSVINETISYLRDNEERIKSNMDSLSLPLFTLFKCLHEFLGDQDLSGLVPYEEMVERQLKIEGNEFYVGFYDDNKEVVCLLQKILTKLRSCRKSDNYSHYSKTANLYARKVIDIAVENDAPEDFLLSMMVRADYTFVKQDLQLSPYVVLKFEDDEIEANARPYISVNELKNIIRLEHEDVIMWIGLGVKHICRMSLMNDMFKMDYLEGFERSKSLRAPIEIITNLAFRNDYVTEKGDRFDKTAKELEEEGERLHDSLESYRLSVPNIAARVLIVKDMEMESYPHQLFIDERSDEFLGQCLPTANVISTELLINTNHSLLYLPSNFSRSFWTPIQSGEITFSGIMSHLENTLIKYQFKVCDKIAPSKPLSSDMNIVCAHGGKNISEEEWFYANGQPILKTNKIVGQGKILVLFVCHSGTAVYEEYDGAVHSMVKKYIRMGYKSVIAPMWSLSTEILPLWLVSFMECFSKGEFIIDAVFHANMAVKKKYIAPSAWACLHLFGNPYLKVADNDSGVSRSSKMNNDIGM